MILRRDESARSGRKAGAAIWIHQIAKARAGVIMTIVIIVPLNQLHHNTFYFLSHIRFWQHLNLN